MIKFNDYRRFRISIDLETAGTIGNYDKNMNKHLDYSDLEAILQKLSWETV